MKVFGLIVAVFWSFSSTQASEITELFHRVMQSKESVRNYSLEHNLKIKQRHTTSDEKGVVTYYDSYDESERAGRTVYDRGKYMNEATTNTSWGDGRKTTTPSRSIYDGSRGIIIGSNNHYQVSGDQFAENPVSHVFNIFDDKLNGIPDTLKLIEEGKLTVTDRRTDGEIEEIHLTAYTGFKSVWRIDKGKGYVLQSFRLHYPSGQLCHERTVSSFREYTAGVWLPEEIIYTGFSEDGTLNRRQEHTVVKAEVNLPEIAPAIFDTTIPPDAVVRDADLGLMYKTAESLLDKDPIQITMLKDLQAKAEKADQAKSAPANPPGPIQPTAPESQAQSSTLPPWIPPVCVLLILAVLGIVLVRIKHKGLC